MLLYLIRHGDALPGAPDAARPLSSKGEADMAKVAKYFKKIDVPARLIFHSGLKRAEQTAQIIADVLPGSRLVKKDSLHPDDSAFSICEVIAKSNEDIMIVGHMPYLSNLVSQLLLGSPQADLIDFKKGAALALERTEGRWRIRWFVAPKLL